MQCELCQRQGSCTERDAEFGFDIWGMVRGVQRHGQLQCDAIRERIRDGYIQSGSGDELSADGAEDRNRYGLSDEQPGWH